MLPPILANIGRKVLNFGFGQIMPIKMGIKLFYSPGDLRSYDPGLYELLSRVYPISHHLPLDAFHRYNDKYGIPPKAKPATKFP
ncbi:MAG: hypothetical protein N3B16_04065 [Candidatus Aminicenantes bacterium]|nr:hypothetical protein [Candidatus Aminicenantes bacterium]